MEPLSAASDGYPEGKSSSCPVPTVCLASPASETSEKAVYAPAKKPAKSLKELLLTSQHDNAVLKIPTNAMYMKNVSLSLLACDCCVHARHCSSTERIARLNMHACVQGHAAPVTHIAINERSNQIISLSADKVIKVSRCLPACLYAVTCSSCQPISSQSVYGGSKSRCKQKLLLKGVTLCPQGTHWHGLSVLPNSLLGACATLLMSRGA